MKSPKWYYVGTEDFLLASKNCFLYFFFLKLMWRFKRRKQIRRGYPVSFKQMFIGLPENITKIDAVYERPIDNCIIFFTGNFMLSVIRVLLTKSKKKNIFLGKIYWIFNGQRFYSHPRSIYDLGLPLFVEALDDVFIWGKNEKTYLFYQNLYWR